MQATVILVLASSHYNALGIANSSDRSRRLATP